MTWAITDRMLGAITGAAVSGACVLVGIATNMALVAIIAGFGVPAGAITGFLMAPRVLQAATPWGRAVQSAVVASVMVAIAFALATIAGYVSTVLTDGQATLSNPVSLLAGAVFVTAFSFGIGLPVALPVSFASAILLRRIAPIGHRIERRLRHHDLA